VEIKVNLHASYSPSEYIVARKIEGELIIVPLVSGIGDMEDELYTLNVTGRAIWDKLDGRKLLKDVIQELSDEFESNQKQIEIDVIGLLSELLSRRMIIEVVS